MFACDLTDATHGARAVVTGRAAASAAAFALELARRGGR